MEIFFDIINNNKKQMDVLSEKIKSSNIKSLKNKIIELMRENENLCSHKQYSFLLVVKKENVFVDYSHLKENELKKIININLKDYLLNE